MQAGALLHVPDANGLVLGVRQNQLRVRVEEHRGDVVVMTATAVHLNFTL